MYTQLELNIRYNLKSFTIKVVNFILSLARQSDRNKVFKNKTAPPLCNRLTLLDVSLLLIPY